MQQATTKPVLRRSRRSCRSPLLRNFANRSTRTSARFPASYRQKELEPIFTVLKKSRSKETPSAKLRRFRGEILSALSAIQTRITDSEVYSELSDALAIVLRGISLAAWNEHQDTTTATTANNLALTHAGQSLRQQLTDDKKVFSQIAARKHAELSPDSGAWFPSLLSHSSLLLAHLLPIKDCLQIALRQRRSRVTPIKMALIAFPRTERLR